MCILRYMPRNCPLASWTVAVLWYTPAIRRSNSDPTTTTSFAFAAAASRSDDGPGIGSARSKRAASSFWQKYGPRNSSGRQTTCAPCFAAAAMAASAFAKFAALSAEHDICTRPMVKASFVIRPSSFGLRAWSRAGSLLYRSHLPPPHRANDEGRRTNDDRKEHHQHPEGNPRLPAERG